MKNSDLKVGKKYTHILDKTGEYEFVGLNVRKNPMFIVNNSSINWYIGEDGFMHISDAERFSEKQPTTKEVASKNWLFWLILSSMLLATVAMCKAQVYSKSWSSRDALEYAFVSLNFDARHAVSGSAQTQNKPSLDVTAQIGANYRGVEVGLEYEDHSALKPKFQRYGAFVNVGKEIYRDLYIYGGVTYGSIVRQSNKNFLSKGLTAEIRYRLTERISFGITSRIDERRDYDFYNDTSGKWKLSNGVKAQIKIN